MRRFNLINWAKRNRPILNKRDQSIESFGHFPLHVLKQEAVLTALLGPFLFYC